MIGASVERQKIWRKIVPFLGFGIFCLVLWILHRELTHARWHEIVRQAEELPNMAVFSAILLTVLSYLSLTCYDLLAAAYLNWPVPRVKVMLASFLSYAFSYNIGLSVLGLSTVRLRLYTAWGLSAVSVFKLIIFASVTSFLGIFALVGILAGIWPSAVSRVNIMPVGWIWIAGLMLLALVAAYLAACTFRRRPLSLGLWEFTLPTVKIAASQVVVGVLDWLLAGAAMYVLLPAAGRPAFATFLAAYLLAQLTGMASQVPGGLGVSETMMLLQLKSVIPPETILGSMLVFRAIYYILPLVVGALVMGGYELSERRHLVEKMGQVFGQWVRATAPQVLAFVAFAGGILLLFSGAVPPVTGRMDRLISLLPLPVIEISHFLASITGVWLLFLGRGLQQRLREAYWAAVSLLALGVIFSFLKGLDYKEAVLLTIILLALLPCRRQFYRQSPFLSHSFTAGWAAAVAIVIAASIWLGIFSHEHIEYRNELWWQFSIYGSAGRSLRASVGIVVFALVFCLAKLTRPAPAKFASAEPEQLDRIRPIILQSSRTYANLALLGDKQIFCNQQGTAFIMYAARRRSRIAMGDPVGPAEQRAELVWSFREQCDRYAEHCVFYEIDPENIPLYLDVGLSLQKLGEEARVRLTDFSIDSSERKHLRYEVNHAENDGCSFRIIAVDEVPSVLPELKSVSDAWLAEKKGKELGFSLGFFEENYIRQFPIAAVMKDRKIAAFANLWPAAAGTELSADLMRHLPEAPKYTMTYLLAKCINWGKQQGFEWFNLGVAPLSGLEARSFYSIWNRTGALIYRHGEHFYNFKGLRHFKDKFAPVWTPKYLASPGGLSLPQILSDVTELIHGRSSN